MNVSAFTFVHNAIVGGLPVIEAIESVRDYVDDIVAVDMESDDGTLIILQKLGCKVVKSPWALLSNPRDTLNHAFEYHTECKHDTVIFFEADEVYDSRLLQAIRWQLIQNRNNLGVWRLQLEQNFQRCRWYPIPVHRVFSKGKGSYVQHPTNCPDEAYILPPSSGFLWDVSNCFRDNWFGRKQTQSELWGEPRALMVPEHFTQSAEISKIEEENRLNESWWQWTDTPFNIPTILKPLVGVTNYAHSRGVKVLLNDE